MGRIDIYPSGSTIVPITASTLGYAEITANQTGIGTSATDITGLSVSITVPAGRRIKITAHGGLFNSQASTNQALFLIIREGATQLQVSAPAMVNTTGTFGDTGIVDCIWIGTPTAGSHTYKVSMSASNTGGIFTASATAPSYIHIEDVTGSQLATTPAQFVPVGTLGYGQRTSNQTGIGTTPVLIGGLSVNVAVPAGRQLKILGFLPTFTKTSGTPTWVRAYIRRSGTDIQRTIESAANDTFTSLTVEHIDSPAAGSYTYEIYVDTDTGTVALDLGSIGTGANAFIIVEDITPTPTPASGAPGSTLAYAELPSTFTGAAAAGEQVVTGLSANVTVPAGRTLRVTTLLHLRSTVASDILYGRCMEDASNKEFDFGNENAAGGATCKVVSILTPTAGAHTYSAKIARAAGTGTPSVYSAANEASFILVEDITGSVWPAGQVVTSGLIASEPWTAYTPSVTQGVAVTSTVVTARYIKMGRVVHLYARLNVTGAGTAGQSVTISLPVPGFAHGGNGIAVGSGFIYDASANNIYEGCYNILSAGTAVDMVTDVTGGSAAWGGTPNIALASGDIINLHATYEAAS